MLRDCFRCGHGWVANRPPGGFREGCPVCSDIPDHVAAYIKDMRDHIVRLRKIARKGVDKTEGWDVLSSEELAEIGIYV